MKVRMLHDRVLVKRHKSEDKSKGGLYIPDVAKDKPLFGTVIAAGPGEVLDDGSLRAMSVKVGDTVLIGKYTGYDVRLDNEEHLVVREEEILAVTQ